MTAQGLAIAHPGAHATGGLLNRAVNAALFLTLLMSPLVFIEPSPYEAAFALLALVAVAAGFSIDRTVLPLVFLLLLWNIGGLAALTKALHDSDAIIFMATSFFMAFTATLFACLLLEDTERRIAIIRRAYIAAAIVCSIVGMAMYFKLVQAIDPEADRLKSTFKDPNVFGPYLILPLLFLLDAIIRRGMNIQRLAGALVLLVALFLSYSRGAWGHFVLSAVLMVALMFLTTQSARFRLRIVSFAVLTVVGVAGLLALLLSFDAIGAMFQERASVVQYYDAGESGRFGRQLVAVNAILENPAGLGPHQFAAIFKLDPHNVYLNAFLAYGWLGGVAYMALVISTIALGFRCILILTPWQPVLIAAYATFIGVALEGFVIDTDHWRHFFLLLGMVWGLSAASLRQIRNAVATAPRRTNAAI
jgi:O-antigen ligase